jgi:MoxR-like ATPase
MTSTERAVEAPPGGPSTPLSPETAQELGRLFGQVVTAVRSVLYADEQTVQLAAGCLLAQGHLLVEDLPGLGKTTLAKALSQALGLDFHRIQFTADLLPADITGAMMLDRTLGEPVFRPGPIFTNLLMADELNRASARSQSALLEAMEERQVSMDGRTMPLPRPFMVLATQNPYDAAGTSPLPHGQRDRFLVRLSLGYPSRAEEDQLIARTDRGHEADPLPPALTRPELESLMAGVYGVHVSPAARGYILDLVTASRSHPGVAVGASPRASLALRRAATALALADGRAFITPVDVQGAIGPALGHRLILDPGGERAGTGVEEVITDLIHQVPVPGAEAAGGRAGT